MKCSIVYVCFFYLNFLFVSCSQPMNKSNADKYCDNRGGLISTKIFKELTASSGNIKEGQATWTSDFAVYSQFVSWEACYETLREGLYSSNKTSYSCLELCTQPGKNYRYVGIRNRECYCLYELKTDKTPDIHCDPMENLLKGKDMSKVNVLNIHTKGHVLEESQKENVFHQCVAMKTSEVKSIRGRNIEVAYGSFPCHAKMEQQINQYVCVDGSHQGINDTCKTFYKRNSPYCVRESSLSWLEAYHDCRRYNGRLVNLVLNEGIKQTMKVGQYYWTGLFRYFSVVETNTNKLNVCVSAQKQGSGWIIEPDDCSVLKMVLCNADLAQDDGRIITSTAKPDKETTQSARHSDVPRNVTQPTISLTTEVETKSSQVIIILVVSVLTFLFITAVVVVTIVAFVRCRRSDIRLCSRKMTQVRENNTPENIAPGDISDSIQTERIEILETDQVEYEVIPVSADPSQDVDSYSAAENVYARTDHKGPDKVIHKEDQQNIYSHTVAISAVLISGENIYDSTKVKTKRQTAVGDKNVYNKINEITPPHKTENVYNKTNVVMDCVVETAGVEPDIYNHTNVVSTR